jgi:hypothetical protein
MARAKIMVVMVLFQRLPHFLKHSTDQILICRQSIGPQQRLDNRKRDVPLFRKRAIALVVKIHDSLNREANILKSLDF